MAAYISECRSCGSSLLEQFLDLGEQYIADFREDNERPPKYPLVTVFCHNCKLVQLAHTVPQTEMYHERYGFKSGISESIKKDLDNIVTHAFQYVNDPQSWLDIASNDGTLLSFVPSDILRVGYDPIAFLCVEAEQHANLIVNDYFKPYSGLPRGAPYDVITSISCFYDMPDPSDFVADVKSVLAPMGVWIIQQNYLMTTLKLSAVDNFCHEHLEYYTLSSLEHLLERFGLEINEVTLSMVNGGSIRTVVSHKGTFPIDPSVDKQRIREWNYGIGTLKTYTEFADSIAWELSKLRRLVDDLHADGRKLGILGASTRGATLWQSAGIDSEQIAFASERNPAKVGKHFSAIGVPIISESAARKQKPYAMLVGPWFFSEEIILRESEYLLNGGRLIIPLPEVTIIDGS